METRCCCCHTSEHCSAECRGGVSVLPHLDSGGRFRSKGLQVLERCPRPGRRPSALSGVTRGHCACDCPRAPPRPGVNLLCPQGPGQRWGTHMPSCHVSDAVTGAGGAPWGRRCPSWDCEVGKAFGSPCKDQVGRRRSIHRVIPTAWPTPRFVKGDRTSLMGRDPRCQVRRWVSPTHRQVPWARPYTQPDLLGQNLWGKARKPGPLLFLAFYIFVGSQCL